MRPTLIRLPLSFATLALLSVACDSDTTVIPLPTSESDASTGNASQRSSGPLAPGKIGVSTADYLIRRWPELDYTAEDCTGPDDCFSMNFATVPAGPAPKFWEYTYGVPLVGLQKLYAKTGDARYQAFLQKYVDRFVSEQGEIEYGRSWPLNADGTLPAANDPTIQDVIQPSMLLFDLYADSKAPKYLTALTNTRANFPTIMRNPQGAFFHKPSYPNQQWLDGIYMSEPFLVKFASLYGANDAQASYDLAISQIKLAAEHTFDPDTKLYYHAWNGAEDGVWLGLAAPSKVAPLPGTVVSPHLWSRSIAWFLLGIVDVLEYLPKDHPERDSLREIVSNIALGLERFQDPKTGLFYQVIDLMDGPLPAEGGYPGEADRPAQPNWLETSSSALFAYGLAKAVRLGDLDASYVDVAKRAWKGVQSQIELGKDGVIIHGTVVGMSVGGTYNAYVNADFNTDLQNGPAAAPATCLTADQLPVGSSPTLDCRYIYVRDNVPQGFGAVLLASTELEY